MNSNDCCLWLFQLLLWSLVVSNNKWQERISREKTLCAIAENILVFFLSRSCNFLILPSAYSYFTLLKRNITTKKRSCVSFSYIYSYNLYKPCNNKSGESGFSVLLLLLSICFFTLWLNWLPMWMWTLLWVCRYVLNSQDCIQNSNFRSHML